MCSVEACGPCVGYEHLRTRNLLEVKSSRVVVPVACTSCVCNGGGFSESVVEGTVGKWKPESGLEALASSVG